MQPQNTLSPLATFEPLAAQARRRALRQARFALALARVIRGHYGAADPLPPLYAECLFRAQFQRMWAHAIGTVNRDP